MSFIELNSPPLAVRINTDEVSDVKLRHLAEQLCVDPEIYGTRLPSDSIKFSDEGMQASVDIHIPSPDELLGAYSVAISALEKRNYTVRVLGAHSIRPAALEIVDTDIDKSIREFADPNKKLDAETQLDTVATIWRILGHDFPTLDDEFKSVLEARVEKHPEMRLMPAPRVDHTNKNVLNGRYSHEERYPASPRLQVVEPYNTSIVDNELSYLFGIDNPSSNSGWAYKLFNGTTGNNDQYAESLGDNKFMVKASVHGAEWVFPMLNIRTDLPSTKYKKGVHMDTLHPATTPESIALVSLTHLLAGNEDMPSWITPTNRFISYNGVLGQMVLGGWDNDKHHVMITRAKLNKAGTPSGATKMPYTYRAVDFS